MKAWRAAALISLPLAAMACGDSQPSEERPATKIANPHHDQLMALSDQLQRLGVMRAIRDNGKRCQRVEATAYQQDYRNMAMWVALCSDGRHWSLFIAPNGDTQVRDCAEARQLALQQCRPVSGPGAPAAKGG
ncbi:MAG TPA: hypothetical protein VN231_12810 [Allosphingosinicella sp.]|nr:hypothetical protein [Allosphingosinicella sp.]